MKTIREKNIPVANIISFIVTGKNRFSDKNFKPMQYNSLMIALRDLSNTILIGSVWAKMDSGKRILIKRVNNYN